MSHCPRLTVFTRGVDFINKRKIRAQYFAQRLRSDDERRSVLRDFDINLNPFWITVLAIMDNRVRR